MLTEELQSDDVPPIKQLAANNIAIQEGGAFVESIFRFYLAWREFMGRRGTAMM